MQTVYGYGGRYRKLVATTQAELEQPTCLICGKPISDDRLDYNAKYCSKRCHGMRSTLKRSGRKLDGTYTFKNHVAQR